MNQAASEIPIGLLFSGGLDSAILLWRLLAQGRRVQPIYIDSRLVWQSAEQRAVSRLLRHVATDRLNELVTLELPLADVYGDHWSVTGRQTPDESSDDAAVYLPGRNPLLIVKARLWCQLHGLRELILGCLETSPFTDATSEFFDSFATALDLAMGGCVELTKPFAQLDKRGVMLLGRGYPLHLTFSCLSPRGDVHCGRCNKCAERRAAFALVDLSDPTEYAASTVVAAAGGD